ncbi:hypothetical protein OSB04_021849 [Centaurea solstitialis]|uniref:Uncharacterized protein n=1 Tax=Centaurea solstitialis TaxID=347529 RepID=A0AA38WI50_9ASTR|nr:hypothetical protein OSB04_021849 [Centaurea solstitialis]
MNSTTSMTQSEEDFLASSKFESCDDLLKNVRKFYYSKGYALSIRASKKDKHVILQCDRGGSYRDTRRTSSERKKSTGSRLINCPFQIVGQKRSDGAWYFKVKDLTHNHEPSTDMSGHPSFRQLPSENINSVKEMSKAGIPPRQILSSMRQQNPNLPVISRTIYNLKRKFRRDNLGNRSMINALFEELVKGGFTYDISHNPDGRISRLFIAHPLSIKLAKVFSSTFVMDCTYKTNKYNMPLFDIIGVSCFNTSFYSGFVFLEKEDEENYIWALSTFKEIIGQDNQPCVIVSDRELALMNGIKNVFPATINLLCVWHIEKNVLANCKKYFGRAEEFDIFMSGWNNVVYSTTEALFEENWREFELIYKEKKDALEAEGAHAKLKLYLQVSTGDFHEVKEKISLAVEHEFNEIKVKLSSGLTPCTGHFTATTGLPCAHKIKYWQGTSLSLDLIHPHWRIDTLSLKLQEDLHDEGTDRLDELLNELRSTYQTWPLTKKKHVVSVISNLVNESDILFEPVIRQPKGRPKSKKKRGITSTTRDPLRFELVESSQRQNSSSSKLLLPFNLYTNSVLASKTLSRARSVAMDINIDQESQGTTLLGTSFNLVNTLCGMGMLSISYALANGGWLSLLLLILVGSLCFYTELLLNKCMEANPMIKTYPNIGQMAFGRKGRVLTLTFVYLELYLVAVGFLILEGDNLTKLFPNANLDILGISVSGKKSFVLLTTFVVLPTTWLSRLGVLAYLSAGGILSSMILFLVVLWGGVFDGIGFNQRGTLWNWRGLPTALSLYTFCYSGHSVIPTLRHSMKRKSEFPKVLLVSFILSTIGYVSMAILGYKMFGDNMMSQVTLNLPTNNISSKIAVYITLINHVVVYAILIVPIATAVEEVLPFQQSRTRSCLIRACLVFSTTFVALMVPYFELVTAFMGSFSATTVSILIPCLCYLKLVIGFMSTKSMVIMMILV